MKKLLLNIIILFVLALFSPVLAWELEQGPASYPDLPSDHWAYEAVTFALAEKNNWQVKIVRIALDILVVIIGVLLGGKFGICTIITVIISGPIIQFVNAKAKRILKI